MPFPTLDELRAIFKLLPEVDEVAIRDALAAAKLSLPDDKQAQLRERVDLAFDTYFKFRLEQLWAAKAPASKTATQIGKIAATADKLVKLLELAEAPPGDKKSRLRGQMNELYRMVLVAQGGLYAKEIGGFSDLPPREFDAITTRFTNRPQEVIRHLDYRADEKLGQFIEALQLWRIILRRAQAYERKKVTKPGDRKRREPNKAMHNLFCTINADWSDAFEALPGDGWNAMTNAPDGPYFRFLGSLFESMRRRVPAELSKDYPELARDMRMTPSAIRSRFRKTAEAKIPALVRGWFPDALSGQTKKKK